MIASKVLIGAAFIGILQPENIVSQNAEATVAWLVRGILAIGLAACAYLLREAAMTMKATKTQVESLAVTVATHQIMFEHWITNLTDDPDNPGRRLSDKIIKDIVAVRKAHL